MAYIKALVFSLFLANPNAANKFKVDMPKKTKVVSIGKEVSFLLNRNPPILFLKEFCEVKSIPVMDIRKCAFRPR